MTVLARVAVLASLLALAGAQRSFAQDATEIAPFWLQPLHAGLDVGISIPSGQFRNQFDAGWDLGGNVAWPLTRGGAVWLQGDLNYEGQLVTDAAANAYGARGGGVSVTSGTINLVFNARDLVGRLTPYVVGGGGMYFRYVELDDYGGTSYCNAFVGFCGVYGAVAPVRSRTQFVPGWDAGAGLRFRVKPIRFFLEARYNTAYTRHGNTAFIPVVLGTEL